MKQYHIHQAEFTLTEEEISKFREDSSLKLSSGTLPQRLWVLDDLWGVDLSSWKQQECLDRVIPLAASQASKLSLHQVWRKWRTALNMAVLIQNKMPFCLACTQKLGRLQMKMHHLRVCFLFILQYYWSALDNILWLVPMQAFCMNYIGTSLAEQHQALGTLFRVELHEQCKT